MSTSCPATVSVRRRKIDPVAAQAEHLSLAQARAGGADQQRPAPVGYGQGTDGLDGQWTCVGALSAT